MPPYQISTPVNCDIDFNNDQITGKVAIVTGSALPKLMARYRLANFAGASGIEEAYVRALGTAQVVIDDKNADSGEKLASELAGTKFVQCDATVWEDQVGLFKEAAHLSSSGKVHYGIANAWMTKEDQTFTFDGKDQEPKKPDLQVIGVNLKGALYTSKLAMHYFVSQNGTEALRENQDDKNGVSMVKWLEIPINVVFHTKA